MNNLVSKRKFIIIAALLLSLSAAFALSRKQPSRLTARFNLPNVTAAATEPVSKATPQPTPKPPYVAYLHEGNLWAVRSDGSDLRKIAAAPAGAVIQDFLWSADGQRCYFSVGSKFYDVSLATGNLASGGALALPDTTSIDHLELANDARTMLVHTLDETGLPGVYGVTIGEREARPLSVDEYNRLAPQAAPLVKNIGDLSVSPDERFVLFKEAIGSSEELFVAECETGRRWQVSNLAALEGFEPSAEATGGRFIIEAAWSPDGRYVIFNPGQSCSETGLCYGRLYLVEFWGGPQAQLSLEMMISLPTSWDQGATSLAYDDGSEIVLAKINGQTQRLTDGNRPKWQPTMRPLTTFPLPPQT